jgi:hypothetical protein
MGYLFGQKRQKVGRLQRQAARCFLIKRRAAGEKTGIDRAELHFEVVMERVIEFFLRCQRFNSAPIRFRIH